MPPGSAPDAADSVVGPEGVDRIAAESLFRDRLPIAERYAALLVGPGVERGLIGPREAPGIWSRHLLNCAVVAELLPQDAHAVDVGSGAGLPGLVLACVRPDVTIDLVEPLLRRAEFLTEAVDALALTDQVSVVRGRAEDFQVRDRVGPARWVTARAVAPLDRLAGWCLPLLARGGDLLAIKGVRADIEVEQHRVTVARLGGRIDRIAQCGTGMVELPTRVVVIRRTAGSPGKGRHD
ncbi:MAG: 16S rRNA (guanine(527)-N(7))-methyltransferase RsmG [Jatrophihabitans sp.]